MIVRESTIGPVQGQVCPGAAADLEDVAARPGEQALAEGAQASLLGRGDLPVVCHGEELVTEGP